ncbi:MAG TPA: polysaccharide biosynthesis protein [Bacillota bacterium]|nr:polysaccharide biosynthesis protein [Bacillota bacterium]
MSEKSGKNRSFMVGAMIMGAAGLIIKIMGAAFRIPLTNLIGDDGLGYYQTAYPIYNLFLTISTAGIPIAISRMVAERYVYKRPGDAHKIFKVSFRLLLAIGSVSCLIFFIFADFIAALLQEPDAALCIRCIAPALFFVPIMSSFRGYFQGRQNMTPTAVSQLVEQSFRVALGLLLAWLMLDKGKPAAAAAASSAASIGGFFGLLVIAGIYFFSKKTIRGELAEAGEGGLASESSGGILKEIMQIAIPITIGAAIMPLFNSIDTAMVRVRLASIGYGADVTRALYAQLSGMSAPLINLVQILITAVCVSLVPVITSAFRRRDFDFMKLNISLALRYVMMISAPMAIGMSVLSKPIMLLLYGSNKESAISAAGCLAIHAVGIVFLGLTQVLTSVLQGVGRQMIPVKNLFIGALAKVAVSYVLLGVPSINVRGAAVGTTVAYAVAALLNFIYVVRLTGLKPEYLQIFGKPLLSTSVMAVASYFAYALLSVKFGNTLSVIGAICAGAAVYVIMVFLSGSVTASELEAFPKGAKIARVLRRLHLVK